MRCDMRWFKTAKPVPTVESSLVKDTGADSGITWLAAIVLIVLLSAVGAFQILQKKRSPGPLLRAGDRLPALELRTLERASVILDWGTHSTSTFVYVFSPDCAWCQRNVDAARVAFDKASSLGYRVVGLSLQEHGLTESLKHHPLSIPVYVGPYREMVRLLKLEMAPETVLVSRSGLVQRVFLGAYVGRTAEELQKVLRIRLPAVHVD
jgi:peroxiredoxin